MTIRLTLTELGTLAPWDAQYIINLAQREVDEAEGLLGRGRVRVTLYRRKLERWIRTRATPIEQVRVELWGDDEQVVPKNGEPRP